MNGVYLYGLNSSFFLIFPYLEVRLSPIKY